MYASALTEAGQPTGPDPAMIALYVFHRVDGEWMVVARQNTLVPVPS